MLHIQIAAYALAQHPNIRNEGAKEFSMPSIRMLIALAIFILPGCFPVAPQIPLGPSYYVMRHLHTPPNVNNPDLTAKGEEYAQRLPDWFAGDPPSVIYVSSTKRAEQTVAPLARLLGITPKIYDPADTPALVKMVKAETGTILIVGHSNTVPDIVEQLGGTRPGPITLDRFGDIWHITAVNGNTLHLNLDGQ